MSWFMIFKINLNKNGIEIRFIYSTLPILKNKTKQNKAYPNNAGCMMTLRIKLSWLKALLNRYQQIKADEEGSWGFCCGKGGGAPKNLSNMRTATFRGKSPKGSKKRERWEGMGWVWVEEVYIFVCVGKGVLGRGRRV